MGPTGQSENRTAGGFACRVALHGVFYKLSGLKRWLKSVPAAVVDDEIGPDMWQWAAARPQTLMLQVDPRLGLLDEHVEQLLEFARRF